MKQLIVRLRVRPPTCRHQQKHIPAWVCAFVGASVHNGFMKNSGFMQKKQYGNLYPNYRIELAGAEGLEAEWGFNQMLFNHPHCYIVLYSVF
ncbi:MAG: hypothetical protein II086_04530 [Ruminococcus sp.]|nr:hypothetical protein [Ruminococcus sp.]